MTTTSHIVGSRTIAWSRYKDTRGQEHPRLSRARKAGWPATPILVLSKSGINEANFYLLRYLIWLRQGSVLLLVRVDVIYVPGSVMDRGWHS